MVKITTIPQLYRNWSRLVEVVSVLSKYGLADWISRLDLKLLKDLFKTPSGEILANYDREARVRLALMELGATFIKLGQILSTRPDLVGVKLAKELSRLQADVDPQPASEIRATIVAELGQPIDDLFARFDDEPLASASIGQIHAARLRSGEEVVVKVQKAGIEKKIRVDLDILAGLAQAAEQIPEFRNYRPRATVAEFQRTILRELDFGREERHMVEFRKNFADNPHIHIPKPCSEMTTPRVLTMERLFGTKLSDTAALSKGHFDLELLARRGAEIYMEMIFEHGFYHADPHPGNILVLDGNVIGLLDFGMVGRIDESLRESIEDMLIAITNQDAVSLTQIITRIGEIPPGLDQAALSIDVTDFVSYYGNLPLGEFDLSGALSELTELIRRYQIRLPARVSMLIKVLIMLEGTARLLNPEFNLLEIMRPFRRRLIRRRLSPARNLRKLQRIYREVEHLLEVLPQNLLDIMQQIQSGRFDVHLDHRGLEPSVNRLVLGMLASALFLGSSLVLSRGVPPLISIPYVVSNISLLGLTGCLVAIALGLRLMRAINKSGHLDRRD